MDGGRIVTRGAPRALIQEHVEPHVVEVQGDAATTLRLLGGLPGVRIERVGETGYCYTASLASVLQRLERAPGLTYLHRPATLEDVFLRITGHELREE